MHGVDENERHDEVADDLHSERFPHAGLHLRVGDAGESHPGFEKERGRVPQPAQHPNSPTDSPPTFASITHCTQRASSFERVKTQSSCYAALRSPDRWRVEP